jgi:hypothetical protein
METKKKRVNSYNIKLERVNMKKICLSILSLLMFSVAVNQVQAFGPDDINKIFKDLLGLIETMADPKTGILAHIDEVLGNAVKLKAFSACPGYSKQLKKPFKELPEIKTKYGNVKCTDYSIPLSAVQSILNLIDQKLIGSTSKPGVMYTVLNILNTAGLKGVDKVQNVVNDISKILGAVTKLLDGLKSTLQVKGDEKVA